MRDIQMRTNSQWGFNSQYSQSSCILSLVNSSCSYTCVRCCTFIIDHLQTWITKPTTWRTPIMELIFVVVVEDFPMYGDVVFFGENLAMRESTSSNWT